MSIAALRQFGVFFDPYYWKTAILISRNGLARQYRNSFLGMLWTLFQPLTMVLIYSLIMPLIIRSPTSNYTLYIIVSLPLWGFFTATINGANHSILSNGETLKRCIVSSTVFPIADVLRHTYTFFISFTTIYAVAMLLGIAQPNLYVLLVPLYFIPIVLIICSLAVAIAFIAPYIRDIGDLATIGMNMMFWLTPMVYQITILPPNAQTYMRFNPFFIMAHPIQMLAYDNALPSASDVRHLVTLTFVSVLVCFSIYRICRRNYVYYL